MANDNQLPVLRDLIETYAEAAPLIAKIEALKGTVREFGPGEYGVPNCGSVTVSNPSVRSAKGVEIRVRPDVLETLSDDKKAELFKLGLLETVTLYSQARSSSVKVEPFSS